MILVPRTKLTLSASGRVVYVYGNSRAQRAGLTEGEIVTARHEPAGHYDRETNLVEFTEPVTMQDGRRAPSA